MSFFSSPLSDVDSQILGHTIGEASGQQVWESLSALVALRAWKGYWTKGRAKLLVRGDSVAMLTMVLRLKPSHSPGLGLLARELALDLAEGVYQPDIASVHIWRCHKQACRLAVSRSSSWWNRRKTSGSSRVFGDRDSSSPKVLVPDAQTAVARAQEGV